MNFLELECRRIIGVRVEVDTPAVVEKCQHMKPPYELDERVVVVETVGPRAVGGHISNVLGDFLLSRLDETILRWDDSWAAVLRSPKCRANRKVGVVGVDDASALLPSYNRVSQNGVKEGPNRISQLNLSYYSSVDVGPAIKRLTQSI
ncbi:hypothetical protein GOBAR_AA13395 [Gossypium barbadense]|uniref:Uncharacterized protein n=1 Tax=Gossypium barbadense TaxID=3634 RepID=A0A2P5XV81_GOSBA|nr:hypothetical protein GOBAR_AA13395 [Gossypium barbadense]